MLIILSPTICKGGDMSANISCIPWPYTYPYAAASVVVHKLGTTGTASVPEIGKLLCLPTGA